MTSVNGLRPGERELRTHRDRLDLARDRLLLGVSVTCREFQIEHEISPNALRALLEQFEDKAFGMVRPSLSLPGA